MDLAKLQIEPQVRTPWEAVDLGVAMTRRWWSLALLSWAFPAAVVFGISSAIFYRYNELAILITWWLKPLFDRGPLYVASQRLFDQALSARQVLWALPGLYRNDLLASITWRRLSLTRSFDLPLTVLEGLKGKDRSARQTILHRRYSNAATWLTLILVHVELVLVLGVFSLAYLMLPAIVEINVLELLIEESLLVNSLYNFVWFCGMCVVGPFFATAGFALYISRRIELEAWDIELRFRHLAARAAGRGSVTASVALGLVVAGLLLSAPESMADEASSFEANKSAAKALIIEVKQEEAFHQIETIGSWRFKDTDSEEADTMPQWLIEFLDFLASLFTGVGSLSEAVSGAASFLEILLWVAVALIVVLLLHRYRREIREFVAPPNADSEQAQAPNVMFGLDIRREKLPENIPNAVQTSWLEGKHRTAVSLLYRGLLSNLVHRYSFKFSSSDTEGECVDIVRQRNIAELSEYVERITRCWQSIAYGHRKPDDGTIEALCDDWHKVFADV